MMFRRRDHKVPELNTTSTADISFMLLIFFLINTSMDVDKGVTRQLPPANPTQQEQAITDVEKDKVMKLRITASNKLLCNDEPLSIDKLRRRAEMFIMHIGSEHIIQVQTDPQASYDTYFHVQNQLLNAYSALRNSRAQQKYGKPYSRCSGEERKIIGKLIPQRISEVYEEKEVRE